MPEPLKVSTKNLPLTLILQGDDGDREVYQIIPASRKKLGAALQKVTGQVRESVLRVSDRR